jgi:hypothetical protein
VVLKGAGAALLLLGSYYGARTLKENGASHRADQTLKALELTANECPAVRGGAVHVLLAIAEDIQASKGVLEAGRVAGIKFILRTLHAQCPRDPVWTLETVKRVQALRDGSSKSQ